MIDILGHPIRKGDIVITNGYWSTKRELSVVEKVTKKAVYTEVSAHLYDKKGKRWVYGTKTIRRDPSQVIVVNQQVEYNKKHYPENML